MPVDLKAYAKPYEVTEGALAGVVLWMLPYRTLTVERVIQELNAIEPEVSYVHADGRQSSTEPDDLKAERERVDKQRQQLLDKATRLKVEPNAEKLAALVVKTDWKRVYHWGVEHQAFWRYEPLVVAVDFPEMDEHAPAELSGFERYFRTRSPDTAERWQVFRMVCGTETANALFYAYEATRDNPAPAAPELNQETPSEDSPLAPDSAGEPSTATMSSS